MIQYDSPLDTGLPESWGNEFTAAIPIIIGMNDIVKIFTRSGDSRTPITLLRGISEGLLVDEDHVAPKEESAEVIGNALIYSTPSSPASFAPKLPWTRQVE